MYLWNDYTRTQSIDRNRTSISEESIVAPSRPMQSCSKP